MLDKLANKLVQLCRRHLAVIARHGLQHNVQCLGLDLSARASYVRLLVCLVENGREISKHIVYRILRNAHFVAGQDRLKLLLYHALRYFSLHVGARRRQNSRCERLFVIALCVDLKLLIFSEFHLGVHAAHYREVRSAAREPCHGRKLRATHGAYAVFREVPTVEPRHADIQRLVKKRGLAVKLLYLLARSKSCRKARNRIMLCIVHVCLVKSLGKLAALNAQSKCKSVVFADRRYNSHCSYLQVK